MLKHPIRPFARALMAGEHLSVEELNTAHANIIEAGVPNKDNIPGSVDAVCSTLVGAVEGVGARIMPAASEAPKRSKRSGRAGTERSKSLGDKFHRAEKKTSSYLAVAGAISPPNKDAVEAAIDQVVTLAKANRHKVEIGEKTFLDFPKLDHFADMAPAILGVNSGKDRIEQVRLIDYSPKGKKNRQLELHAFDAAGFHVLEANFSKLEPGVLYIDVLKATHGRNCEDLALDIGGTKVPGRGNALATAAGLEALIMHGVEHGLHALATQPGSPMVARLYEKMGFTAPGATEPFARKPLSWALEQIPIVSEAIDFLTIVKKESNVQDQISRGEEPNYLMTLDLTNPEAVRQALVGFRLSRSAVSDVPKDVAKRLREMGEPAPKPTIRKYQRSLSQRYSNVRVLSLKD